MTDTDDYSPSPESPFAAEQVEAIRQFIRQEVRRALADMPVAPTIVTVQNATPSDVRRVADEVNRQLAYKARMQGIERRACIAGVSYEEAEREIAREEGKQ
jgi:hypothetical protein